jgi:chitinase
MNQPLSHWSLVPAVILAGLASPGWSIAGPQENGTDKVFVGYLYGQPRGINFRLYTHLCHAFLVADGAGNIQKARNVPSH